MPYVSILIVVGFAVFYHKAAESEEESGLLWASLSVLLSLGTLFVLGWGWLGVILAQAALFLAIGVFRAMRKP